MALSTRDRRALIVLGSVVVIAAILAFLLLREGPPEEEAAPTPPAIPPAVAPTPTPTPPPSFDFFSGRDPFLPLVVAAPAPGVESPTDGVVAPVAPVDEVDGVTEPRPDAEREVRDGASTRIGGHTVTLVDIFRRNGARKAQVRVDGRTYTVGEGERFANTFRLVSIRGACANFLHGDEPFTLCEGGERK